MQSVGIMPFATSPRSFVLELLSVPTNDGGVNHKGVVSDDLSFWYTLLLFVGGCRDRESGGLPVEDAAFEVDDAVAEVREDFGGV